MIEVIRENCFETNSSSDHSLSFRKESNMVVNIEPSNDGYVHCSFGKFGWEVEDYSDAETKLAYALTMVAETEEFSSEEEFYNTEGFGIINDCIKQLLDCKGVILEDSGFKCGTYTTTTGNEKYYVDFNGYIDHQSAYDDYNSLKDFLNDWGINIDHFIFDDSIVLHTDNDNH